jgi:hypothetical protein
MQLFDRGNPANGHAQERLLFSTEGHPFPVVARFRHGHEQQQQQARPTFRKQATPTFRKQVTPTFSTEDDQQATPTFADTPLFFGADGKQVLAPPPFPANQSCESAAIWPSGKGIGSDNLLVGRPPLSAARMGQFYKVVVGGFCLRI